MKRLLVNNYADWSNCWKSSPRWVARAEPKLSRPSEVAADPLAGFMPAEITGQRFVADPSAGDPRQVVGTLRTYGGWKFGNKYVEQREVRHTHYGEVVSVDKPRWVAKERPYIGHTKFGSGRRPEPKVLERDRRLAARLNNEPMPRSRPFDRYAGYRRMMEEMGYVVNLGQGWYI